MSLRVYNTLTQQKELFEPLRPGKVGIYLCGPTVYKPPHIGHMVGPVIFDAIKRYLQFKGYEVTWVVNITDVDDKLINEANATGQSVQQIADRCTDLYLECLKMMGVDTIDKFPKASEHMQDMIEVISQLIERDHAYEADGNVWFSVASDPEYGKLSHRSAEEQEAVRTTEGSGKRDPRDFALWKAAKPGEPTWPSPWGHGRPGWHIECSAMSMKYLGETIDIHGGGDDLKFPHHENELAQSECATGRTFAKYWMHNGLTRVKTKLSGQEVAQKMSKSLGNIIDPVQFVAKNGADLLRYLLLSTHYRRPIDFSDDVIVSVKKGYSVFPRLFERLDRVLGGPIPEDAQDMDRISSLLFDTEHAHFAQAVLGHKMKFLEMMDDDFNTAGAIAVMHELAGEINAFIEKNNLERAKQPEQVQAVTAAVLTLRKLGSVMGLFRKDLPRPQLVQTDALADDLMKLLIELRNQARKDKNFALADAIRNGLTALGITLEDRPDGTVWQRA